MATGFFAQTDAGQQLFDVNNIVYGLRASNYMSLMAVWPRWSLKSIQLDPANPNNYDRTAAMDYIYGFSVTGAVAPIVFISGMGVFVGSSLSNGVTTFYYMGANANTKFFYFDTMRSTGPIAGLKVYKDDAASTVVFNSRQIPMDIVGSYTAPAPSPVVSNDFPGGWRTDIFSGASKMFYRNIDGGAALLMDSLFISLGAGTFAVTTSFSRVFIQGRHDRTPPLPGGNGVVPAYSSLMSGIDGAYGVSGGFYWTTCDSPYAYMQPGRTSASGGYYDVPVDRYPSVLAIRIDNLPFPYSA